MTAPPNFDATPGQIDGVGVNCETTAHNIGAELSTLRSYVEELAAVWLGGASAEFSTKMSDYDTKSRELTQALLDISVGLKSNANNYRQSESDNLQQIRSVET